MTEGGTDQTGVFHRVGSFDDSRLGDLFAWKVLAMLVRKGLLSPEWAERILLWRHTGFSVHSLARVKTKPEAERVGKYMIRCGPDYRSSEADVRAAKPPPCHVFEQVALMAAEENADYF